MDDVNGNLIFRTTDSIVHYNSNKSEYILEEGERILGVVSADEKNGGGRRYDL